MTLAAATLPEPPPLPALPRFHPTTAAAGWRAQGGAGEDGRPQQGIGVYGREGRSKIEEGQGRGGVGRGGSRTLGGAFVAVDGGIGHTEVSAAGSKGNREEGESVTGRGHLRRGRGDRPRPDLVGRLPDKAARNRM